MLYTKARSTAYRMLVAGAALAAVGPAAPAAAQPGQGPEGAEGAVEATMAPALSALGDALARVIDHPDEGVLELVIGPAELQAGAGHLRLPIQLVTVPLDGWLHGFEWEITDGADRRLDDGLLHHVNLIDPDRRELFSPIPRRVMAAGRETAGQKLIPLLGYPVERGTRFLVSAMFASPDPGQHYESAYLHLRLFYSREDDRLIEPLDLYPFYLDVMGPVGPKDFEVPPGRTTVSWEGSPAIDGRILAIGAHLHDYADEIRLEDLTEGTTVWRAEPEVDAEGRVTGVPAGRLWWRGGAKIHGDHVYRVVVEYENPTNRPTPGGGMGVIGGVMLASGDADWPALDREHPEYVADLRNTLEAPQKLAHGHGGGHHRH